MFIKNSFRYPKSAILRCYYNNIEKVEAAPNGAVLLCLKKGDKLICYTICACNIDNDCMRDTAHTNNTRCKDRTVPNAKKRKDKAQRQTISKTQ